MGWREVVWYLEEMLEKEQLLVLGHIVTPDNKFEFLTGLREIGSAAVRHCEQATYTPIDVATVSGAVEGSTVEEDDFIALCGESGRVGEREFVVFMDWID